MSQVAIAEAVLREAHRATNGKTWEQLVDKAQAIIQEMDRRNPGTRMLKRMLTGALQYGQSQGFYQLP